MTSVLFIDDHPIVLRGCLAVLQDVGVEHLHEATGIATGLQAYLELKPDAVILDLAFDGDELAGLTLVKQIAEREPSSPVLVFSMHNNPSIVSRALENGALGYVLKDAPSTEFAAAVRSILAGEPYLSHKLATQVAMLRAKGASSAPSLLSAREEQILGLLARGISYERIGAELGISYKTVTNASSAMRSKLKIDSLAGLVRYAIDNVTADQTSFRPAPVPLE